MSNKIFIGLFGIFAITALALVAIGLFAIVAIQSRTVQTAAAQATLTQPLAVITAAPIPATLISSASPAVSPTPVVVTTPQPVGVSNLSMSALENAQYHSTTWGDYQLSAGIFYRPAAPGETPENYATRLYLPAFGDLNQDSIEDAVVLLQTKNGGNGDNKELAVVLNQSGDAYNAAMVDLGFPLAVESIQIQPGGVILMNVRTLGPSDGLCCPSQKEAWQFQLEGNQLIRLP